MDWHDSDTAGTELPVMLDRMASTLPLNIVENYWTVKLSGGDTF